jgi:hypothetical protein
VVSFGPWVVRRGAAPGHNLIEHRVHHDLDLVRVSTLQNESWCRDKEAIAGPTQVIESKGVQSVTRRQHFANGETLDNTP